MPDTKSPREKVAQIIKEKVSGPHFTDPSLLVAMEQDRFAAADAILTALASGSGDHAELVLMSNAALEIYSDDVLVVGGTRRIHADNIILYVRNGVDALLAENAALREREKTALKECGEWARQAGEAIGRLETSEAAGIVEGWRDRATEAERKLAEAAGLLSEVADEFGCTIEQYHKNGPHWTSADGEMFDVGVVLDREPLIERARTFLGKEAERG